MKNPTTQEYSVHKLQASFYYLPLPTDGTSFQLYAAECEYVAILRELLC
jgi:hypothetical protein